MRRILSLLLATLCAVFCTSAPADDGTVTWTADSLPEVLERFGSPCTTDTPLGPALHFDGTGDGFFLDAVPVAGLEEFTLEAVFDAFVNLGTPEPTPENPAPQRRSAVLIDESLTHPADRWYGLALVAGPQGLVSYVDGVEQCRSDLPWTPEIPAEGLTSLGVRQNKVCWFKGEIFKIRITPRALSPEEFLHDQDILNRP